MTLQVLQISDCHLTDPGETFLGADTQQSLQAVLAAALRQHQPDAIIASGDIAQKPVPATYRRFLATVRKQAIAPLLCLPGNHDFLGAMQAADLPMQSIDLVDTEVIWRLVALDSHEDNKPSAVVTTADLAGLRESLTGARWQYALLATHHPMVATSRWQDRDMITDAQWWLNDLQVHCQHRLRGIVCGHVHQALTGRVADLPHWTTPSTCVQFRSNSEKFAVDSKTPGYRWLTLHTDGEIETSSHYLSD